MRHHRARVLGVCQYPETAWCRLAALTACSEPLFVHSTSKRGEQPDLVCVLLQPAAEGVAGVVAIVPVPVPVMRDAEGGGLVVTLAQLRRKLRVQRRIAPGQGLLHRLMRFAQDIDDVGGP